MKEEESVILDDGVDPSNCIISVPEMCEDGEGKFVLVHRVKVLSTKDCRTGRRTYTNQEICKINAITIV